MALDTATTDSMPSSEAGRYRVVTHGTVALILATVTNLVVLAGGSTLIEYPSEFTGSPFGPLAVTPVVINSTVAVLGATIVFAVVNRYANRPARTFTVLASAALIASFGMFLTPNLSGAPASVFGTLAVMHVTTAVIAVWILLRTIRGAGGAT